MNPGYIYWKNWCWSYSSNTLATWWEERTQGKTPKCWETLRAGERDDRGWDGWMASLTQWTWAWVDSGSWWWTKGGLACCGSWGHKELDMTEWLNRLTGWLLWELKILVGGMPGKWGKKCFHLSGSLHVRGPLGLLWGLNKLVWGKQLRTALEHSKHLINAYFFSSSTWGWRSALHTGHNCSVNKPGLATLRWR